ncbi:MAG: TonB family protein [Nitrospirae bacterium]|nr:TonB family protein [Nitrospirota bacterium]
MVHPRRSQESIKEVVATHRGSLDFIYKKALRNNPTLKGGVIIEFTIAANGDVTGGRIASSTVKDPSFEEQVLKRILTWKFPPLPDSGNTVVSFPIEFSPV